MAGLTTPNRYRQDCRDLARLEAGLPGEVLVVTRDVCVLGLGYVGLPLACAAAEAGHRVIGFDPDSRPGRRPAPGSEPGRGRRGPHAREGAGDRDGCPSPTEPADIEGSDTYVICVPTPLEDKLPDLTMVDSAVDVVAGALAPGRPGDPRVDDVPGDDRGARRARGWRRSPVSPRRTTTTWSSRPSASTRATRSTRSTNTPRVVGGLGAAAGDAARPSSTRRSSTTCTRVRARARPRWPSCWRTPTGTSTSRWSTRWPSSATSSASTCGRRSAPRRPSRSGSPRSPRARASGGTASRSTRPTSPGGCAGWATRSGSSSWPPRSTTGCRCTSRRGSPTLLNDVHKPVAGSRVLVLGVAYKRDLGDLRESPAPVLIRRLESRGAVVRWHDPHVRATRRCPADGGGAWRASSRAEELAAADLVVVHTDHSAYDPAMIVRHSRAGVRHPQPDRRRTGPPTSSGSDRSPAPARRGPAVRQPVEVRRRGRGM